jgi:WD40 repeat protein
MKREIYTTDQERKEDQLIGGVAFPLVNLILAMIIIQLWEGAEKTYWGSPEYSAIRTRILLIPWFVNGVILTLAFLFRPQMGVGYIASFFVIASAGIVLGGLFVVTCAVSVPGWCLGPVGPVVFLILFGYGLVFVARWAKATYQIWWSPVDSTPTGHKDSLKGIKVPPKRTVALWRVKDGSLLHTLTGHEDLVSSIAFSPDGAILASGSRDGIVRLWDVQAGTLLRVLGERRSWLSDLRFSPNGSELAAWLGYLVIVWQVADGKRLYTLKAPRGQPISRDFSPDWTMLASWWKGAGGVSLHRMTDRVLLRTLPEHEGVVERMTFSPEGAILACELPGNKVRLWDVEEGALLHILEGHGARFSPDSALLALGLRHGKTQLWQVQDGTLLHVLDGDEGRFSPDGASLASNSRDGKVRLWGVQEGTLLHDLDGYSGHFSPDGNLVVTTKGHQALLWRAADGMLLHTLERPSGDEPVTAFAPDGQTLAVA